MKTLTRKGVDKLLSSFAASLDHATYERAVGSVTVDISRIEILNPCIKIYVYLDSSVVGTVRNISLVDRDGDVVAVAKREFSKPASKGIYCLFSYKLVEVDDPDAPLLGGES